MLATVYVLGRTWESQSKPNALKKVMRKTILLRSKTLPPMGADFFVNFFHFLSKSIFWKEIGISKQF